MAAQGDGEDKKLVIQRSQLRQHGEFWHVSVSERQKLRVLFLRTVLPPEVGAERALEQWRPRRDKSAHTSTTKVSFSSKIVRLGQCMIAIMKV